MNDMNNKIWYINLPDFITYENYFSILPLQDMSTAEKLNALVRFFIYLGVFLALVRSDYKYLFMGIIAAIISVFINEYENKKQLHAEKFLETKNLKIVDNKICSSSTVENPFMNPSIADISMNPDHPQACDLENEKVKKMVDKNFKAHLFRDVNDIYGKYASERQFYTLPVTTIPGDQTGFAKWLYRAEGGSCKENNGVQCLRNIGG